MLQPITDQQDLWLQRTVNILAASIMAFSLLIPYSRGAAVLMLLLLSLLVIYKPMRHRLMLDEKIWLWIMIAFFSSSIFSFYMNGFADFRWSHLDKSLRFILLIPIYFLFKKVVLSEKLFYLASAAGSFGAGIYAYYEHYILQTQHARGGANHHIVFGDIALCLSVISLVALLDYKSFKWPQKIFLLLGVFGGLVASMFSGARGGWVAIPVILVVFLWVYGSRLGVKRILVILSLVILTMFMLYQNQGVGVSQRVNKAFSDLDGYFLHGEYKSSLGQRMEMFKAAWILFKEKPWYGFQPESFITQANRLEKESKINPVYDNLAHPHNEFLTELYSRGLPGFLVLLAVYFFPLIVFAKRYFGQHQPLALLGFVIPLMYTIFSLSESMLTRLHSLEFYLVIMFYLFAMCHQSNLYEETKFTH